MPVMTGGAAYDLCQTVGWKYGLDKRPKQVKRFYGAIAGFTAIAIAINFGGINPIKALVIAGIVQGFSTSPLMLLIMLMTNNRRIMGDRSTAWASISSLSSLPRQSSRLALPSCGRGLCDRGAFVLHAQ